jgi:hypothetical protein
MSPTLRNLIVATVLLMLAGGVAWYYSSRRANTAVPNTAASAMPYMDVETQELIQLTAFQVNRYLTTPGLAQKVEAMGKRLVFKNEKSGKFTIVPARECTNGKWIPQFMPDGKEGPGCPEDKIENVP